MGCFSPKLILAWKPLKLTLRPDHPQVGTRQLTPCLPRRTFTEPSPRLVPTESPASGRHGFATWGHDAKIIKIGVTPMGGLLGQGGANGAQGGRHNLGAISKCTTGN